MPTCAQARRTYCYGGTNLAIAGLITEPLLSDLRIDRVAYAIINPWATLLGPAFCLPCGRLTSREVAIRAMPFANTVGETSP